MTREAYPFAGGGRHEVPTEQAREWAQAQARAEMEEAEAQREAAALKLQQERRQKWEAAAAADKAAQVNKTRRSFIPIHLFC